MGDILSLLALMLNDPLNTQITQTQHRINTNINFVYKLNCLKFYIS